MLHIAPMAAVSDRHWRTLLRCASPAAVVWTEMTWAHSIADAEPSEAERVIGFSAAEHPVILQLGGCDATVLARAAVVGARRGYDAINLNCGCPAGDQGS